MLCAYHDDWNSFVDTAPNLEESDYKFGFTTDYGGYHLIVISYNDKIVTKKDLIKKDVEALYERKRNKIIVSKINDEILRKIYKIKCIDNYFNKKQFQKVNIPCNSFAIIGDNWYLIYDDNCEIIDYCVLNFDIKAQREFEISNSILKRKNKTKEKTTKQS